MPGTCLATTRRFPTLRGYATLARAWNYRPDVLLLILTIALVRRRRGWG